jgi:hypothetical protein
VVKRIIDQKLVPEKDDDGHFLDSVVLMNDGRFIPIYNLEVDYPKIAKLKQKNVKVYQIYDANDAKFGALRCVSSR